MSAAGAATAARAAGRPLPPEPVVTDAPEELTLAVASVEAVSSVEVVVVLAGQAEEYPDVPWKLGTLAGALALLVLVYVPWSVSEGMGLMAVLSVAGVAALGPGRHPRVVRSLTLARRRQRAVEARAKQAFVDEAVTGTRDRTGILVFYSELEERAVIRPDAGVLGVLPGGAFFPLLETFYAGTGDPYARLKTLIEGLGPLVKDALPVAEDDVNELPDAPRRI
jgi:putative membrane protein